MDKNKLKEYLIQIADNVTPETQLEDIYKQLALLTDIGESESQVENGKTLTQTEVEKKSREWLK